MTQVIREGDIVRVKFTSGTLVEGKVENVYAGCFLGIDELERYVDPDDSRVESVELVSRSTPPQGTLIRAVLRSGEVRVGIVDRGMFIGYHSHPEGVAIPINCELSEFKSWEVIK